MQVETSRLRLLPATPALHRAELAGAGELASLLGVPPPEDWPPADSEYDRDAVEFFLSKLLTGGAQAAGWYSYYAVTLGADARLVANAGYFGPPDDLDTVEIGYSVSKPWRGRGFASEVVAALVRTAFDRGAKSVIAHTRPDNHPSIGVLRRNGFHARAASQRPGMLGFAIER